MSSPLSLALQSQVQFVDEFSWMKIIPVSQEHVFGCAVSCVASRCGMTYREAHALFDSPSHAWMRGYYCEEIVAALGRAGLRYSYERFAGAHPRHQSLLGKAGTIAFHECCQTYPFGHFFIRARKGWMNPWSNYPRMVPVESRIEPDFEGKWEYMLFEGWPG